MSGILYCTIKYKCIELIIHSFFCNQGNIIDFYHNVESMRYCMDVCKSLSSKDCNWISYNQEKELCLALETCNLDSSNKEFLSANESCAT